MRRLMGWVLALTVLAGQGARGEVVVLVGTTNGIKKINTTGTMVLSDFNNSITDARGMVQYGGNIYVARAGGSVSILNQSGAVVSTISTGTTGYTSGNQGLAVDSSGNFYLGNDGGSGAVKKFDSSWNTVGTFAGGGAVRGVAVNGTNLFVATNNSGTNKFSTLDPTPTPTASAFISTPTNNQGLAIGPDGLLYVADQSSNIRTYNPSLTTSAPAITTYNGFASTVGVAVNDNGDIYAADFTSGFVRKYDGTSYSSVGVGGAAAAPRYLATVSVPEPGTLLLGGIAAVCGGSGGWWKRRRRIPAPESEGASEAVC